MTVTVHLESIVTAIAGLSVSGVTIKDINAIPDAATGLCPILIPQPNNFVTDITPTTQSLGFNGGAKLDVSYSLHYVYLHAEAGSGINTYSVYSGLIAKLVDILEAILSNDVVNGAVDMKIESIGNIGVIEDPAGNEFWGVLFSVRVMEFAQ